MVQDLLHTEKDDDFDRRAKRMFCADLVRTENVRNCRLHRQPEMKFLQCWILYVKRKKKRKFRIICHVFHDAYLTMRMFFSIPEKSIDSSFVPSCRKIKPGLD